MDYMEPTNKISQILPIQIFNLITSIFPPTPYMLNIQICLDISKQEAKLVNLPWSLLTSSLTLYLISTNMVRSASEILLTTSKFLF